MPESNARYEILVPYLQAGLSRATAVWLSRNVQGQVHVEPRRSIFDDGQELVLEPVSVIATDTPQTDSLLKQAAAYAAETLGRDHVVVSKTGKDGIQTWPIRATSTPA